MKQKIPKELLKRARAVTAKRPRTVLEHILKHGHITTEELREKYGYDHPPRAARDVREQGIPLETFKVKSSAGRGIAAYRLDLNAALPAQKSGRQQISKRLKEALLEAFGPRCTICGGEFDPTHLQVDHRVPYEVAGESLGDKTEAFMVVCASCNRTKSWACEHCRNWREIKRIQICKSCYWANPTTYEHVAMTDTRRADITWVGDEVGAYSRLRAASEKLGMSVQDTIKIALKRLLEQ